MLMYNNNKGGKIHIYFLKKKRINKKYAYQIRKSI